MRSHAGFPARSGLERRLKKDSLVDTLCEKVVVGDSNERISALFLAERRDTNEGLRGTPKERIGKSEEALRTVCYVVEGPRSHLIWTADNR